MFSSGSQIVTNGLILNYDFANTKSYVSGSTTLNDLSSSQNSAIITGGTAYSGANLGSLVFNGTDTEILISNPIKWVDGTVMAWVNLTSNNFFILGAGSNFTDGYFFYYTGGTLYNNFGNTFYQVNYGLSSNTIYHLATTKSGTVFNTYINGQQIDFQISISANGTLKGFGRLYSSSGGFGTANALIYNIQVYNRALSSDEILQNYNSQKTRFGLA